MVRKSKKTNATPSKTQSKGKRSRGSNNTDNDTRPKRQQLPSEDAELRKIDKNYVINAILKKMAESDRKDISAKYAWAYVFKLFDSIQITTWTNRVLELRKIINDIGPKSFIDKLINKIYNEVKEKNRLTKRKVNSTGLNVNSTKLNEKQIASFVFNLYLEGIHDNYISNTTTFDSMISSTQSDVNFLKDVFSDSKTENYSFVLKDVSNFLKANIDFYKKIKDEAEVVIQFEQAPKNEQVIAAEQRKKVREQTKKEELLKQIDEDDFIGRYICFVPQLYDQIYGNDGTFYLKNILWETELKKHLGEIFMLNSNYISYTEINTNTLKVDGVSPTYLYIRSEQEKQERHSASLISISSGSNGRNKNFSIYDKGVVNVNNKTALVRTSQIYLPILAMYDAGARMITRGVVTEIINILDSMKNIDSYKLKVVPYSEPFEYNFKNETGKVFFKIKTSIGYPLKISNDKYNPDNVYILQINNVEQIKLSATAKQAGASTAITSKLGKWAGDNAPNIEDLKVNRIIKGRLDYRPRFMSTGDGNNAVGYVSFAKFMKETPLLLLDTGKEDNKLKVFGAEYSRKNSPQISQAASASQSINPNQVKLRNVINKRISGNTSNLQRLFLRNNKIQKNKSSFIRFLNEYINKQPSTSEGKINFNYKNFRIEYEKYIKSLSELNKLHKKGFSAREGAEQFRKNPDPYASEGEMERRNALAAMSAKMSANAKKNRMNEENGEVVTSSVRPGGVSEEYEQILIRLNNNKNKLISKLSNKNKTKIIEHLKEYYQENDDNESNRRKFIKGISDIIKSKPLPLTIKSDPMSISVRNIPNIQKYLENNKINKSKMNANN